MVITYSDTLDNIRANNLQGFFVGWPNPPSPITHLHILQGSDAVVLAQDGAQVVGFITAISDGVLCAYIPLLEVLHPYQGQGIGQQLTQRMLAKLDNLYMIDLLCDANLQPFYARLGMQAASGMLRRNYAHQAGADELCYNGATWLPIIIR